MRLAGMAILMLLVGLGGCQAAAPPSTPPSTSAAVEGEAWQAYEPAGAGFRVMMPGVPKESVEGAMPTATLGPLQVCYRDIGPLDRNKSLEMIQGDAMRQRGTLTNSTGTYANGYPALEGTVIESDGTTLRMRVFHQQYRLFILSAHGKDAARFLDSFEVAPR